jgi:hypothetical protein
MLSVKEYEISNTKLITDLGLLLSKIERTIQKHKENEVTASTLKMESVCSSETVEQSNVEFPKGQFYGLCFS